MKFAKPLFERDAAGAGARRCAPLWTKLLSARSAPGTVSTRTSSEQRLRPYSSPGSRGLPDVVGLTPRDGREFAARYSLRPPALPMWLVAVPLPPLASLPPLPPASSRSPLPPNDELIPAPFDEERCKNVVRSVLYELSALLPLCPACPACPAGARCPRTLHSAIAFYADTKHRNITLLDEKAQTVDTAAGAASAGGAGSVGSTASVRSAGSLASARQDGDVRHVATQAHGNVRRTDCYPDEWLGGVRSLRDSYVRLVLRQLRHIERLNRALDQFTGTAEPRAPRTRRAPHLPRTPRTRSLTRSR